MFCVTALLYIWYAGNGTRFYDVNMRSEALDFSGSNVHTHGVYVYRIDESQIVDGTCIYKLTTVNCINVSA
jgi:hypothetical protein